MADVVLANDLQRRIEAAVSGSSGSRGRRSQRHKVETYSHGLQGTSGNFF